MSFEALLEELEALQKAQPNVGDDDDDEKIRQMAGEEEEGEGKKKDEEEDEDEFLGKSFTVDIDGEEVQAYDASEVITRLVDRVKASEEDLAKAMTLLDEDSGVLAKALGTIVDNQKDNQKMLGALNETIAKQGKIIKSLQTEIQSFGNQGRGRKATLSVLDKQVGDGKAEEGMSPKEFMAKAQGALKGGRIDGHEISVIENCLGRGWNVPDNLVAKVVGE